MYTIINKVAKLGFWFLKEWNVELPTESKIKIKVKNMRYLNDSLKRKKQSLLRSGRLPKLGYILLHA